MFGGSSRSYFPGTSEHPVQFIDEVVIYIRTGKGGDGHVSFRREKYVPHGGPDGGDGGRGGNVVFEAVSRKNTLIDYLRARHHFAEDGEKGGNSQLYGAGAEAKVLPVPLGTLIYDDETDELLGELMNEGEQLTFPGGKGGLGNMHFRSSTNQTPRQFLPGEPGEERTLRLELKLLADVGLLGFPNAGKSTFLARVSAARPKIADYPFTTLVPQLGVVVLSDEQTFVLADVPGVIEGAADGAGLGVQFLKHLERCKCSIHLVTADDEDGDPVHQLKTLNEELKAFGGALGQQPQIVALNKTDVMSKADVTKWVKKLEKATGARVFPISGITGDGVPALIATVWQVLALRQGSGA